MRRVWICDSEFDEEERQKCENGGLYESDEHLKAHQGHRQDIWHEIAHYSDQDLSREDVTEETERERYETRHFTDELNDSHDEIQGRREIKELSCISPETNGDDAHDLDRKDRDDRERQRHIEIGIDAAKERRKDSRMVEKSE